MLAHTRRCDFVDVGTYASIYEVQWLWGSFALAASAEAGTLPCNRWLPRTPVHEMR